MLLPEADPEKVTPLVLANMHFVQCKRIHDFIGAVIRPLVNRSTNSLRWTHVANVGITRIHGWLRTLGKLDHQGDSQAVVAGSRAIFEGAVDFTLYKYEPGAFDKAFVWHESAKLQQFEREVRYYSRNKDKLDDQDRAQLAVLTNFINREGPAIRKQRERLGWVDKNGTKAIHPPRWTNRSLEADAQKADVLMPSDFVEYYDLHYAKACWHTHGSGGLGIMESPSYMMPYFAARGFHDAGCFSLIACRRTLELFDAYDPIMERRFRQLELDMLRDADNIYTQYCS